MLILKKIILYILISLLCSSLVTLTLNPANAQAPEHQQEYPVGLESYKHYAYDLILHTWGEEEWEYFNDLINRESGWISTAQNPTSTAYGLGQFLDSTWSGVGCIKTSDPNNQILCTVLYVNDRYGTPKKAIEFHNANNWY